MKKNIDIRPYNNKGERHGLWEVYWDGGLLYKSFFQNNKEIGYEETYYITGGNNGNGEIAIKKYYI
jgi:hypothetical protein